MLNDMIGNKEMSHYNIDDLVNEADYMAKTALCFLGQSPVMSLRSVQKFFKSEF